MGSDIFTDNCDLENGEVSADTEFLSACREGKLFEMASEDCRARI